MRTPLEQSVLASIRAARLLIPGDRVGVAVSGGGDSLALLRLLETLRADLGISLLVVHYDHGLRGPNLKRMHFSYRVLRARANRISFGPQGCCHRCHTKWVES